MSCSAITVEHFSHPQHALVLKQDVIISVDAKCSVCDKSVIGSPAYTCSSDDIGCRKFYLHKSCAELPKQIIRTKQDLHPLTLLPRIHNNTCEVCNSRVNFSYACDVCSFELCVSCAFFSTFVSQHKVICHQGHREHTLTLQRKAWFRCDACWEIFTDYSYVCFTCVFWIHKKCAFSSPIIPNPTYHHHPLTLIFSIPIMHRNFIRYCHICHKRIQSCCWSYYCHKCTFFVHMKCSTSIVSFVKEIEANDIVDSEPDFSQFPLPSEESLFDLIIQRCKLQLEFQGEGEKSTAISEILNDPHIIKEHWSHEHPLELHQVTFRENELHDDDNDIDDDKRELICDGCIQPITASHASYYACIQCCFFLHAFCATKLPAKLFGGGERSFHRQHSLILGRYNRFYDFFKCESCGFPSNGFYYKCEICDIRIEIRCALLPARIRHKAHKQHGLVQRPFPKSKCSLSNYDISRSFICGTGRCAFRMHVLCAFYPSRLKHRYDDHPISLKHPPFFYEGVIYCDICEEPVNNQLLLYHCDKCDHSFHHYCILWHKKVKLGRTIKHSIGNQPHTLALVVKRTTRWNSSPYLCCICGKGYDKVMFFFECNGCGYLACIFCIRSIHNQ